MAAGAGFQYLKHNRLSAVTWKIIIGAGGNRRTDVGRTRDVVFKFLAKDISSQVMEYVATINVKINGDVRLFGFVVNVRERR